MTIVALVGSGETDDQGHYLEAETLLRLAGFRVLNPTKRRLLGASRLTTMRRTIGALIECDGVATLHGWKTDSDALIAIHLMNDLGLPAMPVSAWLDQGPEDDVNG